MVNLHNCINLAKIKYIADEIKKKKIRCFYFVESLTHASKILTLF